MSPSQALRPLAARAREMIASGAIPEPLKDKLQVDLEDAVRRGFLVDLEQLEVALTHFGDA